MDSIINIPLQHPTAIVEISQNDVGDGTKVWAYAHIRAGAKIGKLCTIGGGAYIDTGVVIGDRCKIQNNALIYKGTVVEDRVFIGPGVIVCNDKHPMATGRDGELLKPGEWECAGSIIKRGASIGAGAVILPDIIVGEGAVVGAGSVVTKDVEPYSIVAGNPARELEGNSYEAWSKELEAEHQDSELEKQDAMSDV